MMNLSENHRRNISITLQLVDKTLCEWDDWTRGHFRTGVMYCEKDTFDATAKKELREAIAQLRQLMARVRDDLQLQRGVIATSQSLAGSASVMWENLAELHSGSLRGYGRVPAALADYIDPVGVELAARMNEIGRLFAQPAAKTA